MNMLILQKNRLAQSGYVFAAFRVICAILNYRFMADTDQSRIVDMNTHLVRRSYERALLMKVFERTDYDQRQYQEFIGKFFEKILDFKQKKIWIHIPKENSRQFLKFPKIVNEKVAVGPNHLSHE